MPLDKRNFPIPVWRFLSLVFSSIKPPFSIDTENPREILTVYDDRAKEAAYHFCIQSWKLTDSGHLLEISYRPTSEHDTVRSREHVTIQQAATIIDSWQRTCDLYESEPDFFQQQAETDEIYQDFKLLDPDADKAPFTLKEQLLIERSLEVIAEHICAADETVITADQKDDLKAVVNSLRNDVSTDTKNGWMRKLSGVLAKARRASSKVGRWLLEEVSKELIKELVKKGMALDTAAISGYLGEAGRTALSAIGTGI